MSALNITVLNLLVVDDDTEVEFLFKYNFKEEIEEGKIEVTYFSSAQDCLSYLELDDIGRFFVISDVNMPHMDGFEFCTKVKEKFPNNKVVMMTAYEYDAYQKIALECGASDVFTKPINFTALKEAIYKLV